MENLLVYYGAGLKVFGDVVSQWQAALRQGKRSSWDEVLTRHGSDKATWHSYPLLYEKLFASLQRPPRSILEVGLGTCFPDAVGNMGLNGVPAASHRAWRELFPQSQIYGADIDTRVLIDEPGIRTFYLDQRDAATVNAVWSIMPHLFFDIIIDDGAHTFEANATLLDTTFARILPGGLYIIEDIALSLSNLGKYDEYLKSRDWSAVLLSLPHPENNIDNAVIVVAGPEVRSGDNAVVTEASPLSKSNPGRGGSRRVRSARPA